THELGVRVALGATTDRIARMVIGEGLALTVTGVGIGIAAALVFGHVMASCPRSPAGCRRAAPHVSIRWLRCAATSGDYAVILSEAKDLIRMDGDEILSALRASG